MFAKLREILIGGETGKREMGLAIFFAYCLAFIFFPNDRETTAGMIYPVLGFLAAVYGLEWHGKQSKWKAEPYDEFPPE